MMGVSERKMLTDGWLSCLSSLRVDVWECYRVEIGGEVSPAEVKRITHWCFGFVSRIQARLASICRSSKIAILYNISRVYGPPEMNNLPLCITKPFDQRPCKTRGMTVAITRTAYRGVQYSNVNTWLMLKPALKKRPQTIIKRCWKKQIISLYSGCLKPHQSSLLEHTSIRWSYMTPLLRTWKIKRRRHPNISRKKHWSWLLWRQVLRECCLQSYT